MVENIETRTPLAKTASLLAEAAAKQVKEAGAKGSSGKEARQKIIRRREAIFTEARIEREKAAARKFTQEAKAKGQHVTTSMHEWAQRNKYQFAETDTSRLLLHKQEALNQALAAGKSRFKDLPITDGSQIQHSPEAAEFYTRILMLPQELQADPHIVFTELARLSASETASMTTEAVQELHQARNWGIDYLKHLRDSGPQTDFDFTDGEILSTLEEKFDLYRSKKLEEVASPGHKPVKKDRMTEEERQEYNRQMEAWIEQNIPFLQRRDLDSDLQIWQDNIDAGRYLNKREEDDELRKLVDKLKNGKEIRSKTEEGVTIRRSGYNSKDADKYLDRIYQRRRILEVEIQAEKAALEQKFQQQREEMHREQRDSDFSSIYLAPYEVDLTIQNPATFFEPKLRELEASSTNVGGDYFESQMRRLKLAGEMFGSDFFDRQRLSKEMPTDDINRLEKRMNGMSKAMKRRLSEYVATRIDVIYANYMLTNTADTKKFVERMQSISDRGILNMSAADGALVGDWVGRYELILKGLIKKDTRLFTPQEAEATNIAVEQLLAERKLWNAPYMNFFKDYQMAGTELPEQFRVIDRSAAESIIRRAKTVWRLRMRKPVIMEQGLGPGAGEWETGLASYATLSIEEKMLGAARIRDWFMRKWGPKREFLLVWNTGAYFTARADSKLWKYIQQQTKDLWNTLSLTETAGNEELRKPALVQLAKLLKFNEPRLSVLDLKSPGETGFEATVLARLGKMKEGDLERLVALEEGGFRMQRLLRPYFYMDSLWREGVFKTQIEKAYDHHDKMFLGARLRKAGEAYFFDPLTVYSPEKAKDFRKELKYVTEYRPQGIADFLRRGDDKELTMWFDSKKTDFGIADMDKMFDQINRRFLMINQMIIRDNGEPINYSEIGSLLRPGLTAKERVTLLKQPQNARLKIWWEYAEKAFSIKDESAEVNTTEQYFTIMNSLYTHLTENGNAQIEKLTGIQYDRWFLHMPWEDDLPAHLLQDPKNMPNINPAYKEKSGLDMDGCPLPISHQLTDQGAGPGSPNYRAWNDLFEHAVVTFDEINQFDFSSDEKKFIELMNLVYQKICIYQGPYLGSEAVIKLTAAWLGSAQVKAKYGDLFTGMLDSSVFKEARGPEAPSLSLDKVYEVLEEVQKNVTRLDAQAPHMMHELERFLRIANVHILGRETPISWHSIFTFAEKLPILKSVISPQLISRIERGYPMGLWSYKLMLAAVFVTVVIALSTGKDIAKGGKEETHH